MPKFEVTLDEQVASINNHVKPFEVIEAANIEFQGEWVIFTSKVPHPNPNLMLPDILIKLWYNRNVIIKIEQLS